MVLHAKPNARRSTMDNRTVYLPIKPDSDTKVYRLTTQSSVYLLGIVDVAGRTFACLLGQSGNTNGSVAMRDSDPMIGERSLWGVSPEHWIGHSLTVATLRTSEIREVTRDISPEGVAAITRATQSTPALARSSTRATAIVTGQRPSGVSGAEPADASRPRPYPESHVEFAEMAASCFRILLRRPDLFDDVASDLLLSRRLDLALADSALLLECLAQMRRR